MGGRGCDSVWILLGRFRINLKFIFVKFRTPPTFTLMFVLSMHFCQPFRN